MGGSLITGAIVLAVLLIIPLMLFFGVVGLALFLWCWKRIGPYFVNFGRWMADWRNLFPCGCITLVGLLIVLVVVPPLLGDEMKVLGLVLLILIIAFCGTFAGIVLVVRAMRWFWTGYRRQFWRWMNSTWDLLWRRMPQGIEGRMPGPRPPGSRPAATQPSLKSQAPAGRQAPQKRSWWSTFWALMMGKPPQEKQTPKPTKVETTGQTLGPSASRTATGSIDAGAPNTQNQAARPSKTAGPKRSWFGKFWDLMLGKPSKPAKQRAKTGKKTGTSGETMAAPANTRATTVIDETTMNPDSAKKAPGGFFSRVWARIVRGVTIVSGLVILAGGWVVQKVREGIEWIRVRLNLD